VGTCVATQDLKRGIFFSRVIGRQGGRKTAGKRPDMVLKGATKALVAAPNGESRPMLLHSAARVRENECP